MRIQLRDASFIYGLCNGSVSTSGYLYPNCNSGIFGYIRVYSISEVVLKLWSRNLRRYVVHVARMGEEWGCIGSWWGNRREGDYWGDLGVDGWIILGWISRRWDVGIRTGLGWPKIETVGGSL